MPNDLIPEVRQLIENLATLTPATQEAIMYVRQTERCDPEELMEIAHDFRADVDAVLAASGYLEADHNYWRHVYRTRLELFVHTASQAAGLEIFQSLSGRDRITARIFNYPSLRKSAMADDQKLRLER